jgi:hypothetical protein
MAELEKLKKKLARLEKKYDRASPLEMKRIFKTAISVDDKIELLKEQLGIKGGAI